MVIISKKQDMAHFSRNPTDTERKYNQKIKKTSEKVEELEKDFAVDEYLSATSSNAIQNRTVTEALSQKVNVVPNKGLSTNDFTDTYKEELTECSIQKHTHGNQTLLDSLTATDVTGVISSNIAESAGHIFFKSGLLLQWGETGTTHTLEYDTLVFSTTADTKWFEIGFKSEGV